MLKSELGNSLVRHENVLKEEHKLPVDVCGSKTSVLKLSSVDFPTGSEFRIYRPIPAY